MTEQPDFDTDKALQMQVTFWRKRFDPQQTASPAATETAALAKLLGFKSTDAFSQAEQTNASDSKIFTNDPEKRKGFQSDDKAILCGLALATEGITVTQAEFNYKPCLSLTVPNDSRGGRLLISALSLFGPVETTQDQTQIFLNPLWFDFLTKHERERMLSRGNIEIARQNIPDKEKASHEETLELYDRLLFGILLAQDPQATSMKSQRRDLLEKIRFLLKAQTKHLPDLWINPENEKEWILSLPKRAKDITHNKAAGSRNPELALRLMRMQ